MYRCANASTTNCNPGVITYAWDFGDGTTGSGEQTAHAFNAFGSYIVGLTVTDNNVPARTDTVTLVVEVNQGNQAPAADADGPPHWSCWS